MRDIRGDLQERAVLVDEQIRAAAAHFDKACTGRAFFEEAQ
jgi:hypothetical protein